MRRLLLVVAVAAVTAVMMVLGAGPAMATKPSPPPVPTQALSGVCQAHGDLTHGQSTGVPEENETAHESIPGEEQC